MQIHQKLLTVNPYSRPGTKRSKTTKIAVHYVGNAGSTALANRNYFESLKGKKVYASSHYIVGLEGEVIQCIPDDEVAYTTNAANAYSIGIECCHPKDDGIFTSATRKALVELVASLLKKYGLTDDDIIRHYDVTGKVCPFAWASNSGAKYEDFIKFKQEVKAYMIPKPARDEELCKACDKLIVAGVQMNAPAWNDVEKMNMNYAQTLIERIGKHFGKSTYEETIDFLVSKKIIIDRSLWDKKEFIAKYIRVILIRVSALI